MKLFYITFILIPIAFSCGKDNNISEELIGEWSYIRAVNSTDQLEKSDTAGIMIFMEDRLGIRESVVSTHDYDLEWELKNCGEEIKIRKSGFWFVDTRTYDVIRMDINTYKIEGVIKRVSGPDGVLETIETFLLTRN